MFGDLLLIKCLDLVNLDSFGILYEVITYYVRARNPYCCIYLDRPTFRFEIGNTYYVYIYISLT